MIIAAKFASTCPCCSKQITVGTRVEWQPGAKAMHFVCATRDGKVSGAPVRTAPVARRSVVKCTTTDWCKCPACSSDRRNGVTF